MLVPGPLFMGPGFHSPKAWGPSEGPSPWWLRLNSGSPLIALEETNTTAQLGKAWRLSLPGKNVSDTGHHATGSQACCPAGRAQQRCLHTPLWRHTVGTLAITPGLSEVKKLFLLMKPRDFLCLWWAWRPHWVWPTLPPGSGDLHSRDSP